MSRAPQGPHLTMGLIDTAESYAGVMGKLIGEGKIRGWGQSQAAEDEVRRAHAVTPITAIQSEYSMMERMFEKDVLPACRELGIGFVPFSPLGAGVPERSVYQQGYLYRRRCAPGDHPFFQRKYGCQSAAAGSASPVCR